MKRPPRQVRLDEDVEADVKRIAELTDLSDVEIIRQLVKAGLQAIKENGDKLPLPLRLAVIKDRDRPATASSSPETEIRRKTWLRGLKKGPDQK